jgi:hypothetical protein
MRVKQEHFTPSDEELMQIIGEFAVKERRSKSEMIDILLHQAIKERLRKRNAKKVHTGCYTSNVYQNNIE